MSAIVEATYEDGVLRLSQPLALPNHSRVTVTVDLSEESSDSERAAWLGASESV